jgi:hypothetical protein
MNRMAVVVLAVASCVTTLGQQGRGGAQFPGGTNPDGSLRPSAPVTQLPGHDSSQEGLTRLRAYGATPAQKRP